MDGNQRFQIENPMQRIMYEREKAARWCRGLGFSARLVLLPSLLGLGAGIVLSRNELALVGLVGVGLSVVIWVIARFIGAVYLK